MSWRALVCAAAKVFLSRVATADVVKRKLSVAICSISLLAAVSPAPAAAVTILDTINGVSFNTPGSFSYGIDSRQGQAVQFSSAIAATITDITAYLRCTGNCDPVTLGIMADASGVPSDSFLFSQTVAVSNSGPVVLNSLSWSIAASSVYWLAAIPSSTTTSAGWQFTDSFTGLGNRSSGLGAGTWTTAPDFDAVMASISGTTAAAAVPVPAALPLFASGLGVMGLLGWRRKRKAALAA